MSDSFICFGIIISETNQVSGVPKTLSAPINTKVTKITTSVSERRTFFRPTRDPWNPHIYQLLKYIDKLQEFYLSTGDPFYEEQSIVVRKLVLDLKKKIHYNESFEGD